MAIRSRRLFGPVPVVNNGPLVTLLTCPADRTVVLRSLRGVLPNQPNDLLQIGITAFLTVVPVIVTLQRTDGTTVPTPFDAVTNLSWNMNPGDQLNAVYSNTDFVLTWTIWLWGFGSLLAGAPS